MTDTPISNAAPLQLTINPATQSSASANFFGGSDNAPSFKDVLDTINPLQHIPGVSTIYQALTGDIPSSGAQIAGNTLFGGPLGLLASLFDNILQSATGAGIGGNIIAAIEGKPVPAIQATQETQTASNGPRDGLSPNQRAGYNAYVNADLLA